jgi:hypothetical protein
LEAAVDQAIAVYDGDVRAARRSAIVANTFLTAEMERLVNAVSFGFTHGKAAGRRASETLDSWRQISALLEGDHGAPPTSATEEGTSKLRVPENPAKSDY